VVINDLQSSKTRQSKNKRLVGDNRVSYLGFHSSGLAKRAGVKVTKRCFVKQ